MFGFKPRLTSIEIIKSILLRKHTSIIVKQVNYIENKLLIHQDNDFDVVLCKCPADAKRLFETLREFINHNGIKHIMFTGKINLGKTDTYKMIIEKTGGKKEKIVIITIPPKLENWMLVRLFYLIHMIKK